MQFVKPELFKEAVRKLGRRSPVGSRLNSEEWSRVPLALRERAFFSSRIESARFLQGAQDFLGDFLAGNKAGILGPDGRERTGLKAGSRAQFVKELREFAAANGLGPLDPDDAGTLKDITSEKRLSLIFNTQTQAAHDYGYWKQGQDADVINEFPAQRFIRETDVAKPRPIHQQNEGVVRLKTDLDFWMAMNSPAIGGFGVPWGPWGFNSGMGVEDVDRDEAERLGLIQKGQRVKPADKDFNERLQASVRNLDDQAVSWLREAFGDQVEFEKDTIKWKGNKDERAISRNDPGKSRRNDAGDFRLTQRVAEDGERIFREVRSRDTGIAFSPEDAQSGGAHLSAVVAGRKPLYHEQLDQGTASDVFRRLLGILPEGVAATLSDGHLYVYRPEILRKIISAHPRAYPGLDLFSKIHQASLSGLNGHLLGYGARSMLDPDTVLVRIFDSANKPVFGFRSRRENASRFGIERAKDFSLAFNQPFSFRIE